VEKIQNQASFCQAIIKKANKGDISFMKGDFIEPCASRNNEVRKLRYRIKKPI
jgi:hypothetical protein